MSEAAENMVIMKNHELGTIIEGSFAQQSVSNFIFFKKTYQEELLQIANALFWLFLETWWKHIVVPKTVAATLRE